MDQIELIYSPSESILIDYFFPFLTISIFMGIILNLYMQIFLNTSLVDWSVNKCAPPYLFFSGFIKKEPGHDGFGSIYQNFNKCVVNIKNNKR